MTCADFSIKQSRVHTCIFCIVCDVFTLGGECWQARLRSRHACRTELVLVKLLLLLYNVCEPDWHVEISPVRVGRWYLEYSVDVLLDNMLFISVD